MAVTSRRVRLRNEFTCALWICAATACGEKFQATDGVADGTSDTGPTGSGPASAAATHDMAGTLDVTATSGAPTVEPTSADATASAAGASSAGSSAAFTSSGSASSAAGGASTAPGPNSALSAGCGVATSLRTGIGNIEVDGVNRSYSLDVPEGYDPHIPYWLVFVWHPLGGSGTEVVRSDYDGLRPLSQRTAILVAPEGLVGEASGITGQGWYNTNGSDMAFLRAMLAHFNANLCIDQGKVFSTGFSFGGTMSYAIGCELADVFRAIAPSSGNSESSGCVQATDHPVAVLGLHGDQDDFVKTSRGRTARDLFVARNHCEQQTQAVDPAPCVAYQGCDEGYPVVWCEYPGQHHPWSNAPAVIWDFFSQF